VTARGWSVVAAVAVLGVALGVALTGGGRSPTSDARTPSSSSSSSTTGSSSTTAPPPPLRAIGTFRVASTSLGLVEPVAGASRPLPTTVWFPATQGAGGLVADRAQAPYPLLVFSQGYDISVSAFQALIDAWASAGFVVAAPVYPHTDPSDPAALDENDIVNHPADLRFVITEVLGQSQQQATALSGLIDAGAVGVVGQSDGGDVSLAVAAGSCCQDARVKAAAILSGAELASFGGSYFTGRAVPMLVVQGTADTVNPPGCSVQIYDAAPAPKYYLDLLGAGHAPPYVDGGPDQQVIAEVTTDFFDAELAGQPQAIAAMAAAGDVAGVSALSDAASAPLPPSSCPGAPG
jgi:predicted dienelactone hydrolase